MLRKLSTSQYFLFWCYRRWRLKTTDGGSNWKNISDKYFGGSIGAVAVAPSDESYAWRKGKYYAWKCKRRPSGMWRSDDGGKVGKILGWKMAAHLSAYHHYSPRNRMWYGVAVIIICFGPNEERGVYKTGHGGKTWKRTIWNNQNRLRFGNGNLEIQMYSTGFRRLDQNAI